MTDAFNALLDLEDLNHFDAALTLADRLLSQNPASATAQALRARVLYRIQRHDEARIALAAGAAIDATNPDVRWMQALMQPDGTRVEHLRHLLADVPDHYGALVSLGYELGFCGGDRAEAETLLRRAMAQHPERARARENLALMLRGLGRRDESNALYLEQAQRFANECEFAYNAGTALQESGRHEEAMPWFDAAVRLCGDNEAVQHNRANSLQALDRHEEAIAQWDVLLARLPGWELALHGRGVSIYRMAHALWEQSHYDDALALLDPLREAGSTDVFVWNLAALCRIDCGQHAEAVPLLLRALALDSGQWFVHRNMAVALLATGEAANAMAHAEQAIALDDSIASAHHTRGDCLLALKRTPEAITEFERALELKPRTGHDRIVLVERLQAAGRHDDVLRHADLLDPDAGWARGDALAALGRKSEARQAFAKGHGLYLAEGDTRSADLCTRAIAALDKPTGLLARLFRRG